MNFDKYYCHLHNTSNAHNNVRRKFFNLNNFHYILNESRNFHAYFFNEMLFWICIFYIVCWFSFFSREASRKIRLWEGYGWKVFGGPQPTCFSRILLVSVRKGYCQVGKFGVVWITISVNSTGLSMSVHIKSRRILGKMFPQVLLCLSCSLLL